MDKKQFTRNWTRKVKKNMGPFIGEFENKPINFLEIGIYEARSSCWFLDNILKHPDSKYIGIDPWMIEEMNGRRFPRNDFGEQKIRDVEKRARHNLSFYGDKVTIIKDESYNIISDRNWQKGKSFDIVYVDGVHVELPALRDMAIMWPMIKLNGIMIIDDYTHGHNSPVITATEAFLTCIKGRYDLLFKNNQVGLRKISDKR